MIRASEKATSLIKDFEKLRLIGYRPTPNDVPTIGWGATGRDVFIGQVWTKEQADARFNKDLLEREVRLNSALVGYPTTQHQYDAMLSFAYNVGFGDIQHGTPGLYTSTLFRLHRLGKFADAADQFLRWNKQKGRVLKGLTRRREAERALYLTP